MLLSYIFNREVYELLQVAWVSSSAISKSQVSHVILSRLVNKWSTAKRNINSRFCAVLSGFQIFTMSLNTLFKLQFSFCLLLFCYKSKKYNWRRNTVLFMCSFQFLEHAAVSCFQLSARTSLTQYCINYLALPEWKLCKCRT